eukprot:TRINITY_DN14225_c2_g1_i1.p1 TRINITY_DN14225_c2_g1~~TRINITY_DN14225_c2_g1_i1.p1  ORF type:complete len:126 (-),score=1.58 TRINITY_DN14225_c2_g1_i1:463-840(-)
MSSPFKTLDLIPEQKASQLEETTFHWGDALTFAIRISHLFLSSLCFRTRMDLQRPLTPRNSPKPLSKHGHISLSNRTYPQSTFSHWLKKYFPTCQTIFEMHPRLIHKKTALDLLMSFTTIIRHRK